MIHTINILIHVLTGSAALLTGMIALIARKGTRLHRQLGKVFLLLLMIVIITGLLGVFVFGRNTFLLLVTVLSGYMGFSGYRVLQTKSNRPKLLDVGIALLAMATVGYVLYYFRSIGMIWAPVVMYSSVGYLIFIVAWDFVRYLIPVVAYTKGNIWVYEHIFKMVSAFGGLLSAFSGTVFSRYQPHSQYLPVLLSFGITIGFLLYNYRKKSIVK
jgi:hypothetical protein